MKRYRAIKVRGGFRHHRHPTAIYIFVYASEEQARRGGDLWVGSMQKIGGDTEDPPVKINQYRLDALSKKPQVRFRLSEHKRKEIYREEYKAEDRSWCETWARFSDSEFRKQGKFQYELNEKYKKELILNYGITGDQLHEIFLEGFKLGWTYPKGPTAESCRQ